MSWKLSCTVWRRGKGRDYFKALPILFYKICYNWFIIVKYNFAQSSYIVCRIYENTNVKN